MKFITSVNLLFFIGLIIKTEISAFRCNNGNEILDPLFCNGNDDCGDRSDETYGCSTSRRYCKKGKFTCVSNRACMSITIRCNGIVDCSDQSDEQNCVEQTRVEVQPESCLLEQGKFLCKNKWACLDFSNVCDGRCNCADCSDENTENCTKLDSESCSSCTQYCLPTPDGPRCVCNSTSYETSALCKEIQNCTQGSQCEQHCTRYRNFQRCLCYDGYKEVSGTNGEKCEKNALEEAVLLYSTVTKIKFVNLTKNSTEIAQNGVYCTSLTASRDQMFYGSLQNNKGYIYKSPVVEGGVPEKIVEVDSRVTSISVDWVTNNVYFTSNKSLSVCTNNNGTICTKLKCCGINSVVLAPKIGKMFYTQDTMVDENDLFIMKSNMDGTEEEILLSDECFMPPISLTIDEDSGTLFWLESAEQKLHSVSFDGSNRKIQLLRNDGFSSLTAMKNKFYFTKNRDNSYYYSDAFQNVTGHQDNATSSIRHLYIQNIELQPTQQIENPCAAASCTSLCLTRQSLDGTLNYTCVCENFTPTDDNWCLKDQDYWVQNDESSTKKETYSNTEPSTLSSDSVTQHSTTEQSQITTSQEVIYSSTEPASTSNSPDDISSTIISSETTETHLSTGPTTTINSPKQTYSSTEQNEITTAATSTQSTSIREGLMDYVLIYSTVTKIKAWHLSNDELEVIQDGVDSTALTGIGKEIYYATVDDGRSGIFKISTDSAQTPRLPLQIVQMNSRITSIGVDWITNNVYFTTNVSLSVCSGRGEICTELKCCNTDAVALAPSFRWMFYTHKMTSDGKDLIMKAGMDGSKEKMLLDESFYQLNSLTADESNEKLYWLVTQEQILHSVSFSGNEKNEESLQQEHFSYKYFGTLEGNFFYTTEPSRLEWKFNQQVLTIQDSSTNYVKFLHAYKTSSQDIAKAENPCESSSCTGLCLLRPGLSKASCICENFIQTDENHWCNKKTKSNNFLKNYIHSSAEASDEFSLNEVHHITNNSSVSAASPSIAPLQSEYLMASGVLGFILGICSASFIVLVFYVFQRHSHAKSKRKIKITDEMEM